MWLRIAVISAHVEVLRRKQGAYSGIKAVCILICIGRDAPFGAKPPQAGSHKSLMYLFGGKELFYHKGCKFTFVGVDQTRRRSLRGASTPWFPLFGCASTAETSTPQAFSVLFKEPPSSTPAPLRMTVGTDSFPKQLNICTPCVQLHCPAGTLHLPQATSLAKPLHSSARLSHKVSSSCLATST